MDQTKERRCETRLLCADFIELIWLDGDGRETRRVANLEDISPVGLSLQLETSLQAGTRLRMVFGEIEMSGQVCYVLFRDRAFFIGVKFDEDSRWSITRFAPRHLLDPRTLRHYQPVIPWPEQKRPQRWVH